jgi:hypothetical protein
MNLQLPAIVFEDNEPVVKLTTTTSTGLRKCKHFQMLIAFIKEQVELGIVDIKWISTADNTADILSKIDIHGQNYTSKANKLLGKHQRSFEDSIIKDNNNLQTLSASAKRSNNFTHNFDQQQFSIEASNLQN